MTNLEPKLVFDHFARINQIPRPSKHEEQIIAYLKQWGEEHNLPTKVDETGNVLISKPATPGYENHPTVVLQSHMDMVCEKTPDREINFETDPIITYIDGEWMRAKGTTLGADDGIGCAMQLAILEDSTLEHGPIECVFTRDEETGLTGAAGMKSDFMTGKLLINLDSEDEGQFFVSCAGGKTTRATFGDIDLDEADTDYFYLKLTITGLTGGHSGDDINKKRANSIKLMSRFLYREMNKVEMGLCQINGGRMHNAIPRDCTAVICVPFADKETVRADWNIYAAEVADEYHVTEPQMELLMESTDAQRILDPYDTGDIIRCLQAMDNGVFAMCQDKAVETLVETSSNLASIVTEFEETESGAPIANIKLIISHRSNVMSALQNQADTIKAVLELAYAEVEQGDGYPAWKMRADSHLTKVCVETYKELYGEEPKVLGIHAGLECGLFSERYPEMDMVSMGPTLRGVHSPDECLHIPSVKKVWDHLVAILKAL